MARQSLISRIQNLYRGLLVASDIVMHFRICPLPLVTVCRKTIILIDEQTLCSATQTRQRRGRHI